MHTKVPFSVFTTAVAMVTACTAIAAEPTLKEIMQGLNADLTEVTAGLLTDDFTKVAEGAVRIANHARIPGEQVQRVAAELGPEMATFKQFDTSVHDLALSIAAAAEEKDSAAAIASFHDMIASCFACHTSYKDRVGQVLSNAATSE